MRLEGKVAIVTGAGVGIGRAIALCMAKEGADVSINSRGEASCGGVADEVKGLGRRALAVAADVTTEVGVAEVREQTLDAFGRIDILVNNFGAHAEAFFTGASARFVDQEIAEWADSVLLV